MTELQKDYDKPLLDKTEDQGVLFKTIDKCEKRLLKIQKLDKQNIAEINFLILEINKQFNNVIDSNSPIIKDDFDSKVKPANSSYHFLSIRIDSFINLTKEKIYSQINKINKINSINSKLLTSDSEGETDDYKVYSGIYLMNYLKDAINNIELLEKSLEKIMTPSKSIPKNKNAFIEVKQENTLNKELKKMNKWIGFICLVCIIGSLAIMIGFVYNKISE